MAGQGRRATEQEINEIVRLLATTDLSIGDIAKRLGRSRTLVTGTNRRYGVRLYQGSRNSWVAAAKYISIER